MKFGLVTSQYPGLSTPYNCPFVKDFADVLNQIGSTEIFHLTPFFSSLDYPDHEEMPLHRIKYMSMPTNAWSRWSLSSLRSAFSEVASGVEVDHYILEFMYPAGLLAPLVEEMGIPVSVHIHGLDWFKMWNKMKFRPLIRKALASATHILVSGEGLSDDIRTSLPEFADKIRVVFNVVRDDIFFPPKDKKVAQKSMDWSSNVHHVLCVGHAHRHKRIDLVFEAYLQSEYLRTKTHLHYVGDLPDDRYGRKVLNLAQKLPLKSRTLYPPVSKHELASYYRAADIYVQPSYIEGFGISMIEAAMSGIPVLASPTGIAPYLKKINAAKLMEPDGSNLSEEVENILEGKMTIDDAMLTRIKNSFGAEASVERISSIF